MRDSSVISSSTATMPRGSPLSPRSGAALMLSVVRRPLGQAMVCRAPETGFPVDITRWNGRSSSGSGRPSMSSMRQAGSL
ncbi:MAG: hypothetical protein BWZ10_02795 [candidate division BRC1 bacterium ADurb.BinA364]|nr:MAG: hypothetical protein BWZ10_02795 [candidate division BRC1 bacterium ADurb.BinA364]